MTCLDDDTVLGLVEGRLAPPVLATVDEHLDSCVHCRDVVTQLARTIAPSRMLDAGTQVGRYVIREHLGSGAMGHVYAAHEPELDRRIALKLLATSDAGARERMTREAKAMAKLDHPNVVGVYEVGSANEATYVAMELVEGQTLRALGTRPWRELAPILVDVARGLAAVHDAGVIHRDVKPDNIIVGARDGRARLGDFGLARAGEGATPVSDGSFALGTPTTVAGTPAYMAPEVATGEAATAASDQFSFGVTAYEALASKRPFYAETFAELRRAYATTKAAPLRDVPPWLDAIIRRCLAVDPAKRFASMRVVVDELAAGVARRKSPAVWVGVAAIVASGVTYVAFRHTASPEAPSCAIGEQIISRTWNPAVRGELAALGEPALRVFDRWAAAWGTERDSTCFAKKTDPEATITAREQCLDGRAQDLAAIIEVAKRGNADRALDALSAIPVDECRFADGSTAPAAIASEAAALNGRVATQSAEVAFGRAREAAVALVEIVNAAQRLGHGPTTANALIVAAEAQRATSQLVPASQLARDAVAEAERGHADLVAARAAILRVAIAGDRRDLAAVEDLAVHASALVDRAGAPVRMRATIGKLRGLAAYNRGDLVAARTQLVAAHALLETVADADLERIAIESTLGSVERAAGNLDEAERWHRRAFDADKALRGDNHPDIARDLHNLAGVARLRGHLDVAHDRYTAALAIEVATRGADSVEAALTHNSLGLVALAREDAAAARTEFTLARDIFAKAAHGDLAFAEHNLGLVDAVEGKHRDALAHYALAEQLYAKTIGPAADSAKRLAGDRALSEKALRPKKQQLAEKPLPELKTRDVGVYGSGQAW